ncbi:prepilin-type N-terminal cleavage/methylation domain-containing protein [Candidatus Saccharibacteria bacterium]|nr:prepilin-type N-terminal cleavage/methylation domain-containing protein [Candidatus Saccharibacteria bacterium]
MQKSPGFTIVEIIIVCVVVAILASIGIVSWSATLRNSRDDVRASEHKDWAKRFETFRSKNTVYPNANDSGVAITGEHCLGTGFPSGRCKGGGSPITENATSTIMQQLAKVGTLPIYKHTAARGYVGPWVQFITGTPGAIRVYHSYENTDCPTGIAKDTSYAGATICYIEFTKN